MFAKNTTLAETLTGLLGEETIVEAAYARVDTALGVTRMLSPLGNYLVARPAARAAARKLTEETDIPLDAAVAFGLTDTALHVWTADPMLNRIGRHLGRIPLTEIASIEVKNGRSWHPIIITTTGGHSVELEGRGAVHALAVAFDKRKTA